MPVMPAVAAVVAAAIVAAVADQRRRWEAVAGWRCEGCADLLIAAARMAVTWRDYVTQHLGCEMLWAALQHCPPCCRSHGSRDCYRWRAQVAQQLGCAACYCVGPSPAALSLQLSARQPMRARCSDACCASVARGPASSEVCARSCPSSARDHAKTTTVRPPMLRGATSLANPLAGTGTT